MSSCMCSPHQPAMSAAPLRGNFARSSFCSVGRPASSPGRVLQITKTNHIRNAVPRSESPATGGRATAREKPTGAPPTGARPEFYMDTAKSGIHPSSRSEAGHLHVPVKTRSTGQPDRSRSHAAILPTCSAHRRGTRHAEPDLWVTCFGAKKGMKAPMSAQLFYASIFVMECVCVFFFKKKFTSQK